MSLAGAATGGMRLTEPSQTFKGHTHWVTGEIHLPDRQHVMTCSSDGSLGVWNLQTGRRITNWRDGKSSIRSIALSVDEKTVVSGSIDGVVRLWSIETGKVTAKWMGHRNAISIVCWNQGGERVLSGSFDGTARAWDVETGKTILEINTGLTEVYAAIFSPDSSIIATGGFSREDEFIKIWDADTGKLISILKGHTEDVSCLAWNGSTLISGSDDDSIRIWDTSTWQQIAVFTTHPSDVWGIAISPNGRILASASHDHTARLWNLENGQPIGLPLQHQDSVSCVSFSTDGMLLATGCYDKNAYTWDISAMIKEAGLDELLNDEKSFLHADATRRPVQQTKTPSTVPAGFFSELLASPNSAVGDPISSPSVAHNSEQPHHPNPATASPESVSPGAQPDVQPSLPEPNQSRFFKWIRSKTPARPTVLHRARLHLLKQRQKRDNEALELYEHSQSVADVPLAHRTLRNVSKGDVENKKRKKEEREKKEKEKRAKEKRERREEGKREKEVKVKFRDATTTSQSTSHATSSQLPTQSNITHSLGGPSQAKQSSEPRSTMSTLPTEPAATTTPSTSHHGGDPTGAGYWTHFACCLGCISIFRQS